MPQQPFDVGSKYPVQQQARGLLSVGGATGLCSVKAVQAGMVPRELPGLLGGSRVMAESPSIQKQGPGEWHEAILDNLKARYQSAPADVRRLLLEVRDDKMLKKLNIHASRSESMDQFKDHLLG